MMSFGCDLQRPLTNFKFNSKFGMKSLSGSFRYLMGFRDLDACHVLDHLEDFPGIRNQVMWLNISFPGFIHKCPYTVSHGYIWYLCSTKSFYLLHKSLTLANASPPVSVDEGIHVLHLPNGLYRAHWTISDSQDDNIAELTFFQEIFYHFRIFDFKWISPWRKIQKMNKANVFFE